MSNTPISLTTDYDTRYYEGSHVPTISTSNEYRYNIKLFITG